VGRTPKQQAAENVREISEPVPQAGGWVARENQKVFSRSPASSYCEGVTGFQEKKKFNRKSETRGCNSKKTKGRSTYISLRLARGRQST
jgi:hypothetical protein